MKSSCSSYRMLSKSTVGVGKSTINGLSTNEATNQRIGLSTEIPRLPAGRQGSSDIRRGIRRKGSTDQIVKKQN
jgi:hypothetical protein